MRHAPRRLQSDVPFERSDLSMPNLTNQRSRAASCVRRAAEI